MTKTIFLAAGCFWGAQHYLKQIRGVMETETGFANGNTDNPSYEQVYTDTTGYAEAVRVVFDPEVLPLRKLVELYFDCIEPTSVNRQGEDCGTRYRTGIYFIEPDDYAVIKEVYDEVQRNYINDLAVEVQPIERFFPADESHQDYLDKHPDGYCHLPQSLFEFARKANEKK
ncbi:MAG: peptide-methionine (S)-S-oxide reductase MsrA [Bacteroidales bacterium]|nr:peptide-methionine (S)-S-oxide reductase MsrA [Bacteroidales bacterium]